jgi:branched-chain amino acid transport system substrate-binding protein
MKKLLFVCAIALAMAGFAHAKDDGVIKIGLAAPLTGSYAKIGNDMLNGAILAIEQKNAAGGVLGKKIELIKRDDQGEPKVAVAVARELNDAGVACVVGHFNSGCTIPASEIYNDEKIPTVTPASTNPQVTDRGYKYMFRVCGRDDQQGTEGAKFVANELKLKKVAVLHDKTTYGQGLADEFKKMAEKLGLQVVYYGGFPKEDYDFRAIITAMKEKQPELVYFGGIYNQAGPLVVQMKQGGLHAKFMSGDGVIDTEFIKSAGKNAEGVYLTFGPDPAQVPSAKPFIEGYKARFKEDIGTYSVYGYDAASVLMAAIEKAGTTEGKKVQEAMHTTTFDCAMGKLAFDERGDITTSYYVIWIVKDGQFVLWKK